MKQVPKNKLQPSRPPRSPRSRMDVLIGVVLAMGVVGWAVRTNAYLADHSFIGLVIARNIVTTGHQTFNGIYSTNGVQPLWQYLLAAYSYFANIADPKLLWQDGCAIPLSTVMVAIGLLGFRRAARKWELEPAIFVLPPLIFVMLFGVLYSEAHALYATLGLLLAALASDTFRTPRGAALTGLAAGAVFLTRLDTGMMIAALTIWLFWQYRDAKRTAIFLATLLVLVSPYLIANRYFFGSFTPISGWMKSSFPHITPKGFIKGGLASSLFGYQIFFGIVPIALSIIALVAFPKGGSRRRHVLTVLVTGCLAHFTYVALFTRYDVNQSYVLPAVAGSFALSLAWERLMQLKRFEAPIARGLAARWVGAAMVLAYVGMTLVTRLRAPLPTGHDGPSRWMDFAKRNSVENQTVIISDFPGTVAFHNPGPVIAPDLLTSNMRFYQDMRASGNGLQFLIDAAAKAGKPVRYIVHVGNDWLVPSSDWHAIAYNDPRKLSTVSQIGSLALPHGTVEFDSFNGKMSAIIWKVD